MPLMWRVPNAPPTFVGRRVLRNVDLAQVARYIDWGPFLQTWDLAGPYPKILDDPTVGAQARALLGDARALLDQAIAGRWLASQSRMACPLSFAMVRFLRSAGAPRNYSRTYSLSPLTRVERVPQAVAQKIERQHG